MRKEAHAEARRAGMRRHELSDAEWALVKDLLPVPKKRGRRPTEAGKVLDGMLWILRTGAPWRDLPERYGAWRTVYDRFNLWSRDGTFDRIVSRLQAQMDAQDRIDWELFCIDGSVVRASRAAAGARKKAAGRTGRSCAGALQERIFHRNTPVARWKGPAFGCRSNPRSTP